MKKLVCLLVTSPVFVVCAAQKLVLVQNDLFFDNLKGRVEKVTEIPYSVDSSGKISTPDSCCVSILAYDEKGYRTMETSEDILGKGMNGHFYTKRHTNGRAKEIQFMVNRRVVSTLSGTLTSDGHYGTAQVYDSTGKLLSFYKDVEVNSYGKIISMKNYKPDSTLQQIIVNNYEEQFWLGGFVKDSSGTEMLSTLIKLNESRFPSEVVQTQVVDGKPLVVHTKYIYDQFDEHGNWIQRRELNEKGEVRKITKREIRYRQK
jgi:hypothetical protein